MSTDNETLKTFVLMSFPIVSLRDLSNDFVSSDRSSYCDDVLLYIYIHSLFGIFNQSIVDAIDVTSNTQSRLNSINIIDVITVKCKM